MATVFATGGGYVRFVFLNVTLFLRSKVCNNKLASNCKGRHCDAACHYQYCSNLFKTLATLKTS